MRRVIGIDIHRTFGEVVYWEDGRLRRGGRIDMTRTAWEGFGKGLLASDEVVIEATANSMGGVAGACAVCGAGDHRQPAAGEGDCPGSREDRQDRCRHPRQSVGGRLPVPIKR